MLLRRVADGRACRADTARVRTAPARIVLASACALVAGGAAGCSRGSGTSAPAPSMPAPISTLVSPSPVPAAHPRLQLRPVTSSTEGLCSAPPLSGIGAGRACGLDGRTNYQLGAALGDVTVARATVEPGAYLSIQLDHRGAATLAAVTATLIRRRLALLLDGRVVVASLVLQRITGGRLQLSPGTSGELEQFAYALQARRPSPSPPASTPAYMPPASTPASAPPVGG